MVNVSRRKSEFYVSDRDQAFTIIREQNYNKQLLGLRYQHGHAFIHRVCQFLICEHFFTEEMTTVFPVFPRGEEGLHERKGK